MNPIQMVDLRSQYLRLKPEIDSAIARVIEGATFIKGPEVSRFAENLRRYLKGASVITCGNGTDGLQLAMMALDLKAGDEVIIPAFTYVATAEVIGLLGLTPVLADVDPRTFNIDVVDAASKVTSRTKAIVPVHLFGQCAEMAALKELADSRGLVLIEDVAQSLGACYTFGNGITVKAGNIGRVGVTSFFPSKPLGCYGDGGAVYTFDEDLAVKIGMIASHGQKVKYRHDIIGVNSRLDTIQAAVLDVKLKHIEDFARRRLEVAAFYDSQLRDIAGVQIPLRNPSSTHVFHQYTLQVENRNELGEYLKSQGIPSMVYYPLPLHFQKAYERYGHGPGSLPVAERLSKRVISLPMHTELEPEQLRYICSEIRKFHNA